MSAGPGLATWRDLLAAPGGWSSLLLRLGAVAVAALVLSYLGSFSVALAPWSALALPGGLAVAAVWHWGRPVLVGVVAGVFAALLGIGLHVLPAAGCALLVGGAALAAHVALQRLAFDARLERPVDVALLAAAVVFAAALPLALLLSLWVAATTLTPPLVAALTGWATLSLGMLLTAVAVLSFDRDVLHALQPGAPWRGSLVGAAAVAVTWGLLALAQELRSPLVALALFLPHVVALALVLRGHLAMAATGLLVAALLAAADARTGLSLWAVGGNVQAALAAWLGSALALLLLGHAATVDWRGRSQRWEWALDGSRLGVADWHLQRDDSFVSAAWRTLTGNDANGRRWTPAAWQAQVHADDAPALAAAIASLSSGEAGRRQLELRMPQAGDWRWMEATLMVIERDGTGHPVRLLATLADVHERREALERQRMSASLFQHLHEGLLITDADLRALDVNPAYTDILGVPRAELLGTVPSLLRPTPADPVARQQRAAMWASLRDHGSWRGELLERRRNGELCTLAATISAVRGPADDLRYHVLVISDISEQRAQREQLERQAHYDELTRLPNRARLSQAMDDHESRCRRPRRLPARRVLPGLDSQPINSRTGRRRRPRLPRPSWPAA
ncbi:MAG: PAS domain-containing protein [Rubrivivax sp.]|nr:PAS domain-containing protein [Rubrivivax sp.]